ncbi:hypothetical protein DFH06DRAFT_1424331 [Mycena polygramma]|nr:hypothetical protein DFH06DRAFT_1424331 [Mycena polygramma]
MLIPPCPGWMFLCCGMLDIYQSLSAPHPKEKESHIMTQYVPGWIQTTDHPASKRLPEYGAGITRVQAIIHSFIQFQVVIHSFNCSSFKLILCLVAQLKARSPRTQTHRTGPKKILYTTKSYVPGGIEPPTLPAAFRMLPKQSATMLDGNFIGLLLAQLEEMLVSAHLYDVKGSQREGTKVETISTSSREVKQRGKKAPKKLSTSTQVPGWFRTTEPRKVGGSAELLCARNWRRVTALGGLIRFPPPTTTFEQLALRRASAVHFLYADYESLLNVV